MLSMREYQSSMQKEDKLKCLCTYMWQAFPRVAMDLHSIKISNNMVIIFSSLFLLNGA
jgi:hypothetical protein